MSDQYEWHQAERVDMNEGWIWVRNEVLRAEIEERRPVLLLKRGGESLCCEVLWADDTWLGNRNHPIRASGISAKDKLVFLSAWYRRRLGIDFKKDPPGSKIELTILPAKSRMRTMWWQLRACARHPQIAVVMSTVLAVIGAGLGIIGVAAVLEAVFKIWWIWIPVALVGVAVILLGFRPLYLRAKN